MGESIRSESHISVSCQVMRVKLFDIVTIQSINWKLGSRASSLTVDSLILASRLGKRISSLPDLLHFAKSHHSWLIFGLVLLFSRSL